MSSRRTPRHPSPELPRSPLERRWLVCAAVPAVLAWLIYLLTLCPTLAGGDSAELTLVAQTLGVAHPPGYPLFTLLARAFAAIPLGTIAARINFFSAFCDGGAAFWLSLTVARWTRNGWAGLTSGLLFAFSPIVWSFAVVAEVFALNNLLIAVLLYCVLVYREQANPRAAEVGALVIGLGISNHHTFLFYAIPAVLWALWGDPGIRTPRRLLRLAGWLSLGLLPYLYLPIASARTSLVSWGDETTFSGFLTHVLRREYGTFRLAAAQGTAPSSGVFEQISAYVTSLPKQTGYLGLPLAIYGAIASLKGKRFRDLEWLLALSLLFYLLVFSTLANLPIDDPLYLRIQSRFWQQANVIIFVWIGFGVAQIGSGPWRRLLVPSLAVLALIQIGTNYRSQDQSGNRTFEVFSRAVLKSLPEHSIVLTSGEAIPSSLRYFQLNEHLATSARLIDQSMLTRPWSHRFVEKNYPGVAFPGTSLGNPAAGAYDLEQFFRANSAQAEILLVNGVRVADTSYQAAYDTWPMGLLDLVLPKTQELDLDEWMRSSERMFAEVPIQQWERWGSDTWEYDLGRLYWRMRYSYAAKLLLFSNRHGNERRSATLAASLFEEVAKSSAYRTGPDLFANPLGLYRNLGLADQALSSTDPRAKAGMIAAWKHYLSHPLPNDPLIETFRQAIASDERSKQ